VADNAVPCFVGDSALHSTGGGFAKEETEKMNSEYLPRSMPVIGLALALVSASPTFGQAPPTITNITNASRPTASYPALAPGDVAVIVGTGLADCIVSAAAPQTSLCGVEAHLVSISSDLPAGLLYVSPTRISFIVPNIPSTEVRDTRIVIARNGKRFDDLTSPGSVIIGTVYLESSPNPALYDQPLTLTAHVTTLQGYPGSLANTIGSITFMDGETTLAVARLANVITFVDTPPTRRYDVSFTTSRLTTGEHSIWATYSGDNTNKPGSSGVITQVVKRPEITIWSGPNPSIHGNTVTLVATFLPSTCTGSVVFFDEWEELGTATIDGGRALIQTAALPVGNHPITVKYNGDGTCPPLLSGPANDFAYRTTSQTVN
jgi:hypothetical protein